MLRTQISLTKMERTALDAESERTGKSLSELIRIAVNQVYGSSNSAADDLAVMKESFGSWSAGSPSGAEWVNQIRPGSRLDQRFK